MINGTRYVGLDVHKHEMTACILDQRGKKVATQRLPMTRERLMAFAQNVLQKTDQVALEATTNSWAVVQLIEPHVDQVIVSNPLATKAIAHAKVKTDKVDAQVLAQLLRCDYLPGVWKPDEQTQQMRQLSSRRAALVQDRTAVRNRIHSTLAARLLAPPMKNLFGPNGLKWLKELTNEQVGPEGRVMIETDMELLEAIERQIQRFDQLLAKQAWHNEQVRLLMTLPGVDMTVAQSLLAALGNVERFPSADQAASYLGLVPSTRQSAAKCYHGPITKQGNSQARWMLIQAAQHLARHPGPLGHFFRRLKRRKNHNVAVVATARKLVTIAWHMLRSGEPYRYSQPKSTETKLARLRVRATGQRRSSGPAKGQKPQAKLPGGSRTIKSLDRVYESEGLPPREPPTAGERRAVRQSGARDFVDQIAKDQRVARKRKARRTSPGNT